MRRTQKIRTVEKALELQRSLYDDVEKPPKLGNEAGRTGIMIAGGRVEGIEHNSKLTPEAMLGTPGTPGIIHEMRNTDPQIQTLGLAVKLPIIGTDWGIKPANHNNYKNLSEEQALEHVASARATIFENSERDFNAFIREGLLNLDYGFMLFEPVWDTLSDATYVIRKLAPRMPLSVTEWHEGPNDEFAGVTQQFMNNQTGMYETKKLEADRLILISHMREGNNFAGVSIFRPIWAMWTVKKMLLKLLSISFEREALGVPVATRPETGSTPEQDASVEKLLRDIRAHQKAYGLFPHGWELEWYFNEGGSGSRGNIIEALRYIDEQILNSGLAQFIGLGSTSTGNRAVAKEHVNLFWLALNGHARAIATPFNGVGVGPNQGLIKRAGILNYGEQPAYPSLYHMPIETKNLEEFTSAIERAQEFIGIDDAAEIYVRTFLGIPLRKAGDKRELPPAPDNLDTGGNCGKDGAAGTGDNQKKGNQSSKPTDEGAHLYDDLIPQGAELFVAFAEIGGRLDTAPDELAIESRLLMFDQWKSIGKRVNTAVEAGDIPALPKKLPALRKKLVKLYTDEAFALAEFGAAQVNREIKRQNQSEIVRKREKGGANVIRTTGPRTFADSLETDTELMLLLEAQAEETADRVYMMALARMRGEAISAMRRQLASTNEPLDEDALMLGYTTIKAETTGIVASAISMGREEAARLYDGIIRGVQYSAVLDRGLCPECASSQGDVYGFQSPGHHAHTCPNNSCQGGSKCRCILIYLT